MDQIIMSGKTKQQAIEKALEELGLSRAEARVEVIQEGSRGFFGLGGRAVKVRVSRGNGEGPLPDNLDPEKVTRGILDPLGIEYKLDMRREEDAFYIKITSKSDEGLLIGRRGQTLDAIKHLVQRILTSQAGQTVAVSLEVGDYRERREEALREKAVAVADKVVEVGKSLSLEPMTAQDRRIVHLHLADRDDLRTYTAGDGSRRRVIVALSGENGEAGEPVSRGEGRDDEPREPREPRETREPREPASPYEDIPDPSFRSKSISSMARPRDNGDAREDVDKAAERREEPRSRGGRDERRNEDRDRPRRSSREENREQGAPDPRRNPEEGRSRRRGRRGEGPREEGGTRIRKTFRREDDAPKAAKDDRQVEVETPKPVSVPTPPAPQVATPAPPTPPAAPRVLDGAAEAKPFSSDLARSVLGLDENGAAAKASKKRRYR